MRIEHGRADQPCLDGIGRCGPGVQPPIFLGCVDADTNMDGIDEGCSTSLRHCLVTATTSQCVQCLVGTECNDANECTTDACPANACTFTPGYSSRQSGMRARM